jgi:hypothetical protein
MWITKNLLRGLKPCKQGYIRFLRQTNHTNNPVLLTDLIGTLVADHDLVWLVMSLSPHEAIRVELASWIPYLVKDVEKYLNSVDKESLLIKFPDGGSRYKYLVKTALPLALKDAEDANDYIAVYIIEELEYLLNTIYWFMDEYTVTALLYSIDEHTNNLINIRNLLLCIPKHKLSNTAL